MAYICAHCGRTITKLDNFVRCSYCGSKILLKGRSKSLSREVSTD